VSRLTFGVLFTSDRVGVLFEIPLASLSKPEFVLGDADAELLLFLGVHIPRLVDLSVLYVR
jgi:hypothetical protein